MIVSNPVDIKYIVHMCYFKGLHKFMPTENQKYDVIWIQWVLGYITDSDLVEFLKKCR